jgi:hypothetical protein
MVVAQPTAESEHLSPGHVEVCHVKAQVHHCLGLVGDALKGEPSGLCDVAFRRLRRRPPRNVTSSLFNRV